MMARAFRDLSPKVIFLGVFVISRVKGECSLEELFSLGRGKVILGSSFPHFSITRVKAARCNGVFVTIMKPVAINSAFKLCQNLPLYLP